MAEPIRQCIACRTKKPKGILLRVSLDKGGKFQFDSKQGMMGRGFYICPTITCLSKTREHKLIGKKSGKKVPASVYLRMAENISEQQESTLEKLLGFAARSNKLIKGTDATMSAIGSKKLKCIVMDDSAGATTRSQVEQTAIAANIPIIIFKGNRSLDSIIGKVNCRCVGITDCKFAKSLLTAEQTNFQLENDKLQNPNAK